MKVLITNYTFNPTAKTVTFNGLQNIELNRLLLITNATRNTIIYNFASPALGGTVNGNVLTLGTNTTGMESSDKLQIFYENEDVPVSEEALLLLRRITASLRGVQNVDSSDRLRITLDSNNIGNFPNNLVGIFDGISQREQEYVSNQQTFGTNKRPLLIST